MSARVGKLFHYGVPNDIGTSSLVELVDLYRVPRAAQGLTAEERGGGQSSARQ